MPRTVKLTLEYDYRANLVQPMEDSKRGLIFAYLSKDLGHQGCLRVVGSYNNTLEIEMRVPDGDGPSISPGAGCTFRFAAAGKSDQGIPVMRQVGSAFFTIEELLVSTRTQLPVRHITFPNLENPRTGTVPSKGTISLVVNPCGVGRESIRPANKYDYVPQNYPEFERVLINIQQRAGAIHQELRPTQPNTVGLKMPLWRSAHLIAPGALFATPRSAPASEQWWIDCVIAATRRAYPKLRTQEETMKKLEAGNLTESERMNILMLAHTAVVAAGTCYISDGIYVKPGDDIPLQKAIGSQAPRFSRLAAEYPPQVKSVIPIDGPMHFSQLGVEFRGAEDFAIGAARVLKCAAWGCVGAIDCEDGGADICMQARDFMGGNYASPMLRFFQEAANNYDVCQLLKYVNGDELANSLNTNRLGGHMDAGYATRDYTNRLRENGSSVHPVLEGFAGRMDSIGADSDRSTPVDYAQNPVIIGEGTGLMMPLANDQLAAQLEENRQYLRLNFGKGNLRGIRFMMSHSKSEKSMFYNSVLSMCPLRVADDYPVIEHVLLQKAPGQDQLTICQPYLDFLNGSPKNAARLVGRINEDEIPYMQELLKHHFPVPAYESRANPPVAEQKLDQLCRQINGLRRVEKAVGLEYFQIYFNETDVRAESTAAIFEQVKSKDRVCGARYHFENWGLNLGTWCLTLHLNA